MGLARGRKHRLASSNAEREERPRHASTRGGALGETREGWNGSRTSFRRLARRPILALSAAGLVLVLATAAALAVSGDGKSVYAVSQDSNAVVRFNRNTATGAITQPAGAAGCISETGAGPCADGHALTGADAVTVSADGKSVYVTSHSAVLRL